MHRKKLMESGGNRTPRYQGKRVARAVPRAARYEFFALRNYGAPDKPLTDGGHKPRYLL
jgi:hypothetical protein